MTFVVVLAAKEDFHKTLLFQSMFLLFPWHKSPLFSFCKQGNLFITLCYFNQCFSYFLDINNFCSFMEAGKVFPNTLLFQSKFLLFPWHKLLLFSFSKQDILFITLCCFNPCFCYFIHISNFRFRSGSRGSSS